MVGSRGLVALSIQVHFFLLLFLFLFFFFVFGGVGLAVHIGLVSLFMMLVHTDNYAGVH